MSRRREVTAKILEITDPDRDPDQAILQWYRNIRSTGGFRLTDLGYQSLIQAGLQSWQVPVAIRDLTKPQILALDRCLQWPYYLDLRRRCLVLFNSREAMLIGLYGDLGQFLRNQVRDPVPGISL